MIRRHRNTEQSGDRTPLYESDGTRPASVAPVLWRGEHVLERWDDQNSMRKALAQNPNLLRTLLGLSFTLIFMLSYAVYANTIDTAYYTYTTEATTTTQSSDDGMTFEREYDEGFHHHVVLERDHRSQQPHWVNVTAQELAPGATLTVFDAAGLWTHSLLGAEDATDFSCPKIANAMKAQRWTNKTETPCTTARRDRTRRPLQRNGCG